MRRETITYRHFTQSSGGVLDHDPADPAAAGVDDAHGVIVASPVDPGGDVVEGCFGQGDAALVTSCASRIDQGSFYAVLTAHPRSPCVAWTTSPPGCP